MTTRMPLLPVSLIALLALVVVLAPSSAMAQGTPGYWKNHSAEGTRQYDSTWDSVGGPGASFLGTRQTWLDALSTPAGGSAYNILAKQYAAAALNVRAEAFITIQTLSNSEVSESGVVRMVGDAETLLRGAKATAVRTPEGFTEPNEPTRADFIELAEALDRYNNMVAVARDAAELEPSTHAPTRTSWGDLKVRFEK